MLHPQTFIRTLQVLILATLFLPALATAQQRDKVSVLEDNVQSLQKDYFSLQKELLDLEKQVVRSGISETTNADLKKLSEIDVLKANLEKLSVQVDALNKTPGPAAAVSAPSSVPAADDSAAVAALKTDVGNLSLKVEQLQAQLKKAMDAKPTAPAGTAPVTAAAPTGDLADSLAKLTEASAKQTIAINMMWTLITGFLVMFMQAGFALVEAGFTRAKNAGHTMAMNFMVYGLGMFGYWVCGFAIQFGGTGSEHSVSTVTTLGPAIPAVLNSEMGFHIGDSFYGIMGGTGYFLSGNAWEGGIFTLFLFQMVFMDTTATVPTGAMAERWKFISFVIYGLLVGSIMYPIFGNWVWGGGWLAALGKNWGLGHGHVDFAGSSVVHLQGGVIALVGAYLIGPRYGKYNKDGSPNPIPGHNIPMAMLGTLILAFGWFGFNPGSTLAGMDGQIGIIATNTMLAGTTGCIMGMTVMWFRTGKPDMSFMCNGLLAGLVAITAPCAFVESWAAALIGATAGVIVVFAAIFVEEVLKVDDPVGAVAVHGFNGLWGCLALGLFANGKYGDGWNSVPGAVTGLFYGDASQLAAEVVGCLVCIIFDGALAWVVFKTIQKMVGLRTDTADEVAGLDIPEMGAESYPKDANPISR